MKNFKQFLLENTSTPLKTLKGSAINRSKYGVGKDIGGQIYVHKNYMRDIVPKEILDSAISYLPNNFKFNTIVFNKRNGIIRFDAAPNFDSSREPYAGSYIVAYPDGRTKSGSSESIWHHKWLWVKDDYNGFNVKDSYDWSNLWLNKLQEPASGSKEKWKTQLTKYGLDQYIKEANDFIERAGKTARPWKNTKVYKNALDIIQPGDKVLDYGSGSFQKVKPHIIGKGAKYMAYDTYNNIGSLTTNNDIVMGSNVLNVAVYADDPLEAYNKALGEMRDALSKDGVLIVNMPNSGPKDSWMSPTQLHADLNTLFHNVERRGEVFIASNKK